jgi:hypothetical protein
VTELPPDQRSPATVDLSLGNWVDASVRPGLVGMLGGDLLYS